MDINQVGISHNVINDQLAKSQLTRDLIFKGKHELMESKQEDNFTLKDIKNSQHILSEDTL